MVFTDDVRVISLESDATAVASTYTPSTIILTVAVPISPARSKADAREEKFSLIPVFSLKMVLS